MEAAVRCSGFDFAAVDYINAHGTSTYYNDLYETQAIQDLFQEHAEHLLVSSTKGVTGHCLGAAGGIEAVFLAKAVAEQVVPPTANLVQQDPLCTLQCVPNTAKSADIVVGMSNSFGFGGTNASIVMTKCDG
jgi:3-oxoacyl-[acyl-carrier-protein] synthase II